MRLPALLASIAVLALASHAQAQPAPQADPVRVQLARELMEVSGGREAAETQIRIVYGNIGKVLEGAVPPSALRIVNLMQKDMEAELIKAVPEMIDITVDAYAAHLTEAELKAYIAWQKTDTARAVQAKLPAIMQQVVQAQTPMMQRMIPTMMRKAMNRACEEAKCTSEERERMAAVVDQLLKAS